MLKEKISSFGKTPAPVAQYKISFDESDHQALSPRDDHVKKIHINFNISNDIDSMSAYLPDINISRNQRP